MEQPHDFDYPSDDSEGQQYNLNDFIDISEEEDNSSSSESENEFQTYSWCRNAENSPLGQLTKRIRELEKETKELRRIRRRLTDELELTLINEEIDYIESEIKKLNEKISEMEEEFLRQYE